MVSMSLPRSIHSQLISDSIALITTVQEERKKIVKIVNITFIVVSTIWTTVSAVLVAREFTEVRECCSRTPLPPHSLLSDTIDAGSAATQHGCPSNPYRRVAMVWRSSPHATVATILTRFLHLPMSTRPASHAANFARAICFIIQCTAPELGYDPLCSSQEIGHDNSQQDCRRKRLLLVQRHLPSHVSVGPQR
jgi:hypothetical protein